MLAEKKVLPAELSEISGISRRAIVHYENYGKRPPVDKLKKLSEVIGISADCLVGTKETTSKQDLKLSFSLMKRLRVIEKLPLRDQKLIFQSD